MLASKLRAIKRGISTLQRTTMDEQSTGQVEVQEAQPDAAMPTAEKATEEAVAETQGMSERTREQFEKLKRHNEELAAKLAEQEKRSQQTAPQSSVLDELYPQNAPADVSPETSSQYEIGEDGSVDVEQLNRALREARELAQKAREEAQFARKQIEDQQRKRDESRVHEKFPQLVPGSSSFDPDFYKRVKNELIGQMMEGKTDYMKAAETVATLFNAPSVKQEVEQKVEEYKKSSEAKLQINAGSSSATNRPSMSEEELVARTRQGDLRAFAERLKRAGL